MGKLDIQWFMPNTNVYKSAELMVCRPICCLQEPQRFEASVKFYLIYRTVRGRDVGVSRATGFQRRQLKSWKPKVSVLSR